MAAIKINRNNKTESDSVGRGGNKINILFRMLWSSMENKICQNDFNKYLNPKIRCIPKEHMTCYW